MGWWEVKDVETGGLSPTMPDKETGLGPGTRDVIYNGDGPADLMDVALRDISKLYKAAWKRKATKDELRAVFNFCCNGMFSHAGSVQLSPPDDEQDAFAKMVR